MEYPSFEILEDWMQYRLDVTTRYPNFFILLAGAHPELTAREVKLCALIVFECKNDEIAARMGKVSIEAVLTAKARLKKKFKMRPGERLRAYLLRIVAGNHVPPPPANS